MRNDILTPVNKISLLLEAVSKGIIDVDDLETKVAVVKDKEYLDRHKFKIWQGKNGYWYTRILEGDKRKLIRRKTRDAIESAIIEIEKAKDPEIDPTFKQMYESWLSDKQRYKEVKDNTILRYTDDYRRYFAGTEFEETHVSEIDDFVLDDFVRGTISKFELTSKSYSCFRTVIIGVLKHAKRKRFTTFSVSTFFKDFEISKSAFSKGSDKKRNVYKEGERRDLYEYLMSNPTIENLGLAFMCLTGLRIGELSSLKYEDNVESCKLYVHRTETRRIEDKKRVIVVQDTAKMGHDDEILLPKAAQRIIDITHMRTNRDEYLFSVGGRRITAQTFRRHLNKACKEIGIEYRPPHQMRKTYASILLANGVDEAIIQKEMRHTDIATTRAYYQYIIRSDDKEKAIIDEVIGL